MKFFKSNKLKQEKENFHKQLTKNHLSWYNTFLHLGFYSRQLCKDIVAFAIPYLIYHEFSGYEYSVELAGIKYIQQNSMVLQLATMFGAFLSAAAVIWAAHFIIHTTFIYPKYISQLHFKNIKKSKRQKLADKITNNAIKAHTKRVHEFKQKKARHKLYKK